MPKAKNTHSTTAPATPPPLNETWLRVLAPSFELDASWRDRDPVSKAMVGVSGAADRLSGLAHICWGLSWAENNKGAHPDAGPTRAYAFLAKTLTDVAKGIEGAHKLYRAEMDRQDEAALFSGKRAAK